MISTTNTTTIMKMKKIFFNISTFRIGLFLIFMLEVRGCFSSKPEQVHLALGTNETEMVVTWSTVGNQTESPIVRYGLRMSHLSMWSLAETSKFENNLYTYRTLMTGLKPKTIYYYKVGNENLMSKLYQFRTLSIGNKWNPRFAIYGDLGLQNEKSLPYLSKEVETDDFDAIFHIGDMAYDLHERDGQQGNDFMNSIESVAARVPYMTCPGNHEATGNFSHYDARFSMIGDRHHPDHRASLTSRLNNHFYSLDLGPAHILLFSTEYYYFTEYGWDQIERQFHFLEEDLKRANANRAQRPWIIVMGHRPLYCVKIGDWSCNAKTEERPDIRQGIRMRDLDTDSERQYGLEDLFFKYGVDLQFYGHEHFYARMLPLYNFTVMNGTDNPDNPYENPAGPMHITTGSAGNRELHPEFNSIKEWVAFHQYDYGYTRMTFLNQTHILLEQVSDDQHGAVIDKVEISKQDARPRWMP